MLSESVTNNNIGGDLLGRDIAVLAFAHSADVR